MLPARDDGHREDKDSPAAAMLVLGNVPQGILDELAERLDIDSPGNLDDHVRCPRTVLARNRVGHAQGYGEKTGDHDRGTDHWGNWDCFRVDNLAQKSCYLDNLAQALQEER